LIAEQKTVKHGYCVKHDAVGELVVLARGNRQYWYIHHKWQAETKNCYVGPVGRIDIRKKFLQVLARKGIDANEAWTEIVNRIIHNFPNMKNINEAKQAGDEIALEYIAEVMGQ
jgi:hypothetical protein